MVGYYYIAATVLLTVYGQLILKWRMLDVGALPDGAAEKILFLVRLVLDPYIFSGLAAAFIAAIFWMAAMSKFDISYAYPFTSLSFVLVLILAALFFGEPLNLHKIIGIVLIVLGLIVSSSGGKI